MNVTIVSGGRGSINLQKGMNKLFGIECDNLINMYDDGKSSGIVRKYMRTFGPSDMRKNHIAKYNMKTKKDKAILDLFDLRISKRKGQSGIAYINNIENDKFRKELKQIWSKINKRIITDDFSVMNLIYGHQLTELGWKGTDKFFKKHLGLESNIIVNSNDETVVLQARTENGKILKDESSIVDFNDSKDRIKNINFVDFEGNKKWVHLNSESRKVLMESDIIIISPGTVWSSLIPTFKSRGWSETISKTKAKVYCVLNLADDGDTRGYSEVDYYNLMKQYLPAKTAYICSQNVKAKHRLLYYSMSKTKKHSGNMLAILIMGNYLKSVNSALGFDFDNTLYFKGKNEINEQIYIAFSQLEQEKIIVTGNEPEHVGDYLYDVDDIYSNNGCESFTKYNNNIKFALTKSELDYLCRFSSKLKSYENYENDIFLIRMKPFGKNREQMRAEIQKNLPRQDVVCRGKTSIEIFKKGIRKDNFVKKHYKKLLYFGDEPKGNDKEMFERYNHIQIKKPKHMLTILRLLK